MFAKVLARINVWVERNKDLPEKVPFFCIAGETSNDGRRVEIYANGILKGEAVVGVNPVTKGQGLVCVNADSFYYVLNNFDIVFELLWPLGVWDDEINWDDNKYWNDGV